MEVVSGTFAATGQSSAITPQQLRNEVGKPYNVTIWGTFVGTVKVTRSFDGGTNYYPLTALGSEISFTAPCSEIFEEAESGVKVRLECTAYTSGTINYRIGYSRN